MKKLGTLMLLFTLFGCSSPIREGSGSYTNTKGDITTANIKMEGDNFNEVELDETTEDTTKKKEGANYNMKIASIIGKEWNEQVMFLEEYIEKNGIDKLQLDDEGKATNEDVLTGCTISIDKFLKAIEDAESKLK